MKRKGYHQIIYGFVSDPDQGYGVFIDWMLEESDGLIQKRAEHKIHVFCCGLYFEGGYA